MSRSQRLAILAGVAVLTPAAIAAGRDLPGRRATSVPAMKRARAGRDARLRTDGVRIHTRSGADDARAEISEPAGVIRLFRVVAPKGTHVTVTSAIPGIAGVTTSIPIMRDDPSATCAQRGDAVACTQGEEWCPMPAASWRIRVRKRSGPAGWIRVTFVVGALPRGR
ncbi:MAG TPA: hypothetical protein VG293_06655 [Solirubrobacteraceae bacterium]|nr:hypothetical protein [Solirubrobacteraceae bacterium]